MKKRKKVMGSERLSDMLKRVSIGSISELGLPAEVMSAAVANIEKLRQGVLDVITKEVGKVVSRVDFLTLTEEIFRNYTIKLNAEIRLEPKVKEKKSERSA